MTDTMRRLINAKRTAWRLYAQDRKPNDWRWQRDHIVLFAPTPSARAARNRALRVTALPGPREDRSVMTATPNGCRHCGIPKREHAQQWLPPVGWHTWEQPTQEQIKARMLARRTAPLA